MRIIGTHAINKWAKSFVSDLAAVTEMDHRMAAQGFSLGLTFELSDLSGRGLKKLNSEQLIRKYRKACNRLFLLDFEGTMAFKDPTQPMSSKPSAALLQCLSTLAADPRNTIFILSGKRREILQNWFGSIKKIGLAAEHGFYLMMAGSGSQSQMAVTRGRAKSTDDSGLENRIWMKLSKTADVSWLTSVQMIMDMYSDRIEGSFAEYKESSAVWHFGDVDPQFAAEQANELRAHLTSLMSHFPIKVVMGSHLVEARCAGINKGTAVEYIISHSPRQFDLVVCIGDDRSDEDMFSSLNASYPSLPTEEESPLASPPDANAVYQSDAPNVFSITVGKKPSHARYWLSDANEVNEVMQMMARESQKTARSVSMMNLTDPHPPVAPTFEVPPRPQALNILTMIQDHFAQTNVQSVTNGHAKDSLE
eukprot:c6810_g1_i2.p1 GENE.c6810_g1_i2~~c6810_g1_i2.p1  ORF type:complete len:471 (-),score=127.47 c6810_g1_i2:24-1286(-)